MLELPLPGSPGLNDWLFATMGARTGTVQACLPIAPRWAANRGCFRHGGDADVPLLLESVRELLAEPPPNASQPVVWHQLGWKPDGMYSGMGGQRPRPHLPVPAARGRGARRARRRR